MYLFTDVYLLCWVKACRKSKSDDEEISSSYLNSRGGKGRSKVDVMGTDGAPVLVGEKGRVFRTIYDVTERYFLKGFHCRHLCDFYK